jgi:hypothetical protein
MQARDQRHSSRRPARSIASKLRLRGGQQRDQAAAAVRRVTGDLAEIAKAATREAAACRATCDARCALALVGSTASSEATAGTARTHRHHLRPNPCGHACLRPQPRQDQHPGRMKPKRLV